MNEFYPEACRKCGLYENCATWKITAKSTFSSPVDVLFVGSNPGRDEDEQGTPFAGDSAKFLYGFIDALEGCSYAVTNAVKCANKKDGKTLPIGKKHVDACRDFLLDDIRQWQPKIVVALGATALQSIWPDGPGTVGKARGCHKLPGFWLIVVDHPFNHISGSRDLTAEYERLMDNICRILEGDVRVNAEHDIRLLLTWGDVLGAVGELTTCPTLAFDFEDNTVHDKKKGDPQRLTMYHEGVVPLCVGWQGRRRNGTFTPCYMFPLEHRESPFRQYDWKNVEGAWVLAGPRTDGLPGVSQDAWAQQFLRFLQPIVRGGARVEGAPEVKVRRFLIGHNIKYDLNWLSLYYGIHADELCGIEDTLTRSFVLDQSKFGHNLGDLANTYLGWPAWWHEVYRFKDAVKNGHGSFGDPPLGVLTKYCGMDVTGTNLLFQKSLEWSIPPCYRFLMEAVVWFRRNELRGVPVSESEIKRLSAHFYERFGTADDNAHAIFQQTLEAYPVVQQAAVSGRQEWQRRYAERVQSNIPPEQIEAEIGKQPGIYKIAPQGQKFIPALAELTGFYTEERTKKTGMPSYSGKAIEDYAEVDKKSQLVEGAEPYGQNANKDLWRLIHAYRKGRTLLSNFLKPMSKYVIEGRMHPSWHLTKTNTVDEEDPSGTETGRLATSDPNLLNAKKDPLLLGIYTALPGYWLFKFDFAQMELRRMADVFNVQALIDAFSRGEDPYRALAMLMWDLRLEDVTEAIRDDSKRNVLARIYLEGTYSLAKRNKLDRAKLDEVDRRMKAILPELDPAIEACFAQVERGEFITTGFGRRRKFELSEKTGAWNFPIQSECSDITTSKFIQLAKMIDAQHPLLRGVELMLHVHDALLFQIPKDNWEAVELIRTVLLDTGTLPIVIRVPLDCDIEYGPNWAKLQKLKMVKGPEKTTWLTKKEGTMAAVCRAYEPLPWEPR